MKAPQNSIVPEKIDPYRLALRSFRRRLKITGLLAVALFVSLFLQGNYFPDNRSLNFLIGAGLIATVVFAFSQDARRTKFADSLLDTDDAALLPLILENLGLNSATYKKEMEASGEVIWRCLLVSPQQSACLRRLLPQMDSERV